MRATLTTVAAVAALAAAAMPGAAGAAGWHSEQPVGPSGVPVAIGAIGDLSFWAPNRGLAISAGNDAYPAGVWAYDGVAWRQLATVCGGGDGRVAWAGPNEFWTVSDMQPGQELLDQLGGARRSLCHFADGELVASYAEPVVSERAYLPMSAAVCLAPNDCWFGGAVLPGTLNRGAFHLHWDGSALSAIPSLETLQPELGDPARPVFDVAVHGGQLYESVSVLSDADVPSESGDPVRIHRIQAESSRPFVAARFASALDYGDNDVPAALGGFQLTSDGQQLWGVASGVSPSARVTLVRRGASPLFEQVALSDPEGALPGGTTVTGAAAEPGGGGIWISYIPFAEFGGESKPARVARITPDGAVEDATALPSAADGIGRKGRAKAIACPGAGQCWMATDTGWLFHRGDPLPRDVGFRFDHLLTQRPRDNSLPTLPPDDLPLDDSGAEVPSDQIVLPGDPTTIEPGPSRRPARALVAKISAKPLSRTRLRLRFTLLAKARVQAVARHKGKVVSRSKAVVLRAGRRQLVLKVDPRRWPDRLAVNARRVGGGR